jgi:hypothetical protein
MDELIGILVALGAMFLGLWGIGFAYGDFRQKRSETPKGVVLSQDAK